SPFFIIMPEITEKELPQTQKALYLKAMSAVQMNNMDYAISLLQAVLKENPGFVDGRRLLRECELKEYGGKKKGGLFSAGGPGMKLQSVAKKDPLGALPLIEKELEKDPANEQANDLLFDVCLKLEMPETAAFAL